jgi:hypothetical protein
MALGLAMGSLSIFMAFKGADYLDDRGSMVWWVPFVGFILLAYWLISCGWPA